MYLPSRSCSSNGNVSFFCQESTQSSWWQVVEMGGEERLCCGPRGHPQSGDKPRLSVCRGLKPRGHLLTSCVTWGSLLNLSVLWFFH